MRLGIAIAVLLTLLIHPLRADASVKLGIYTLRAAARLARMAFAGTVAAKSYRRDGNTPLTDYRFEHVRFARAADRDSNVTISVWGNWGAVLAEMPVLEVGHRYIILASDTGSREDWYIPFVGLSDGVFRVEPGSGRSRVFTWEGWLVLAVKGGHLAVLSDRSTQARIVRNAPPGPFQVVPQIDSLRGLSGAGMNNATEPGLEIYPLELDPGTALSEQEFLAALREH
jgi:hypothetical protein